MAQVSVPCPLGERDFHDLRRLDPLQCPHLLDCDAFAPMAGLAARQIHERTASGSQWPDALKHGPTKMPCEPGAHFPREPELPIIVVADQKRVEVGIVRLEPANDELLTRAEF